MLSTKYTIKHEMTDDQRNQLLTLTRKMWWGKDRTIDEIHTMSKHCIPFAVIEYNTQRLIGFARVLTDEVKYAYIYDVMTEEDLRCIGIGKMIMNAILSHPILKRVKNIELTCVPEMMEYYKKFGFTDDFGKVVAMRRVTLQPDHD